MTILGYDPAAILSKGVHTMAREPTDEAQLPALLDSFYGRVQRDPVLAPVFDAAIGDWDEHLGTLAAFWSSVMLTSGRYSGNPVAVHRAVANIGRPLFADWLALFTQTAAELFDPTAASAFTAKAERIAVSLQLALFHRPGDPPAGLTRKPAA